MTVAEKIISLNEKLARKQEKLAETNASIERKRNAAKALNSEIEAIKKSLFDLNMEQLFSMLKDKGIGIEEITEAVTAGIFDKPETVEDCAINSTKNMKQEEKTDDISGSGETLGNA